MSAGVQPKAPVSLPEFGCAAVATGTGLPLVGNGFTSDPRTARWGHRVTPCSAPLLYSNLPSTVTLEAAR